MTSPETSRAALADTIEKISAVPASDLQITRYQQADGSFKPSDGSIKEVLLVNAEHRGMIVAALRAPPAVEGGATKAHQAAQDNLREAWSALAMIRETIETLAPSGSVKAAEHLDGPTFMHEADALVLGIRALSQPQIEGGAVREALEALRLQEVAEEAHTNCPECDGEEIPELCPVCFPLYDDARLARRAALAPPQTGPEAWELSQQSKDMIVEIDNNARNARLNANNIIAGTPAPPQTGDGK